MLYIMRHGKTDWNALHKLQGHTDIPLNEEGRNMAREAAEQYRLVHFDVCFSSPLVRAEETAQIVLKDRQIPIITDDRLMEMGFGIYEGIQDSFQIPDCPINVLFKDPVHYQPVEGGESLEQLFERTGNFLKEVVKPLLEQDKDVLIVGHGAMNSAIISQVRKLPLEEFWSTGIKNCRLICLQDGSVDL